MQALIPEATAVAIGDVGADVIRSGERYVERAIRKTAKRAKRRISDFFGVTKRRRSGPRRPVRPDSELGVFQYAARMRRNRFYARSRTRYGRFKRGLARRRFYARRRRRRRRRRRY